MSIATTLFFPLSAVDLDAAVDQGWERGPLGSGRSSFLMSALDQRRTQFYVNRSPLQVLLAPDARTHLLVPKTLVGPWLLAAAELVKAGSAGRGPRREISGYLLLHLEQSPGKPEIQALTTLGEFVRPDRKLSASLLEALAGAMKAPSVPWSLSVAPRVFALSLSDTPDEGGAAGSVRWDGSTATGRRLASLIALPPKAAIRVADEFPTDSFRPTPSFLMAVGRWSAVAVRQRIGVRSGQPEPLSKSHIVKLRTTWTDAVLLELIHRDALTAIVRDMSDVAIAADGRRWRGLAQEFNRWRSDWALRTTTDHPLESALGARLSAQLGTHDLMTLLDERIKAHADEEGSAAEAQLTFVVLLLTVAAAALPVTLALATPDWNQVWRLPAYWISCAVLIGILVAWGWRRRRVR